MVRLVCLKKWPREEENVRDRPGRWGRDLQAMEAVGFITIMGA